MKDRLVEKSLAATNNLNMLSKLKLPALKSGSHTSPEEGLCAAEMISFIEREKHSDHPECVCPVITAFLRSTNDWFNDEERQLLLPILHTLVGTVSPTHEQERAIYFAKFATDVFMPLAYKVAESAAIKSASPSCVSGAIAIALSVATAVGSAVGSAVECAGKAVSLSVASSGVASSAAASSAAGAAAAAAAAAYVSAAASDAMRKELVNQSLIALNGAASIGSRLKSKGFTNPKSQLKKLEFLVMS